MPTAAFSFSGGKVLRTIARVLGISNAPNTPCSVRNAMTPATVPINPMPIEAAANPAAPRKNVWRRPNRSPSFPPKINSDASASM